jgi:hypothetical protein
MDNNKHSARFLVSLFLMSKYSLKYNLNSSHHSILRYLADCIDQNFKINQYRFIKISLTQIEKYTGCSLATVKRAIDYILSKRLLRKLGKQGKMPIFFIGKLLTAYQQRHAKVIHKKAHRKPNIAHSELYLIEASNSKDNNKEVLKNKDQKDEKTALRELAKKLGMQSNH